MGKQDYRRTAFEKYENNCVVVLENRCSEFHYCTKTYMVLCQDLEQIKMGDFSY